MLDQQLFAAFGKCSLIIMDNCGTLPSLAARLGLRTQRLETISTFLPPCWLSDSFLSGGKILPSGKKSPKIYISDSGLLHGLLNLKTLAELESHPKLGASWEGFIINEIIESARLQAGEYFFWVTHNGAELDLLLVKGGQKFGFEVKRTSSPQVTPSMRIALTDLNLKQLCVIHAGEKSFNLTPKIRAVSYKHLLDSIKPFV